MATGEASSKKDASISNGEAEPEAEPPRRHRRHGYRGYPNRPAAGGDIHWGSGFAGIGAMNGPVGSSGVLTERTRNHAARDTNDDRASDE